MKETKYDLLIKKIKLHVESLQMLLEINKNSIIKSISDNDPNETLLLQHVELVYIHKLKLLEELLK